MTILEEILGLLSGSPELHAYLLARPEQLQTTDYADIITGAPIALTEKGRLLERLSGHMAHSKDADLIRDYSACLHMALQALALGKAAHQPGNDLALVGGQHGGARRIHGGEVAVQQGIGRAKIIHCARVKVDVI